MVGVLAERATDVMQKRADRRALHVDGLARLGERLGEGPREARA